MGQKQETLGLDREGHCLSESLSVVAGGGQANGGHTKALSATKGGHCRTAIVTARAKAARCVPQ